jgi:hypothetical protein
LTYEADRAFADAAESAVIRRLAELMIRTATAPEERRRATDLVAGWNLEHAGRNIAVHLRRYAARDGQPYFPRYPNDINLRSYRASGARTEWAKIIDGGLADLLFYAFETGPDTGEPGPHRLIDLHAVRRIWGGLTPLQRGMAAHQMLNKDGTTGFTYIDLRFFRPAIVSLDPPLVPDHVRPMKGARTPQTVRAVVASSDPLLDLEYILGLVAGSGSSEMARWVIYRNETRLFEAERLIGRDAVNARTRGIMAEFQAIEG